MGIQKKSKKFDIMWKSEKIKKNLKQVSKRFKKFRKFHKTNKKENNIPSKMELYVEILVKSQKVSGKTQESFERAPKKQEEVSRFLDPFRKIH